MYRAIHTLEELKTYLSETTVVAFDFKTASNDGYKKEKKADLDDHKSHIVGISFSMNEGEGIYLPLKHRIGYNANGQIEIWEWLADFFTSTYIIKIAHNLALKSSLLYAHGIIIKEPIYDTIAAAQLVYKNEKELRILDDCDLKKLVQEYFQEHLPSYTDTIGGLNYDELDPAAENTIRYACADADYTLRLYHLLNNWFDCFRPKHRLIVEKVESLIAVYVGLMRYNGLPINHPFKEVKNSEVFLELTELKEKIAFIIGDNNIEAIASTVAFRRYFFDYLKLPKVQLIAMERNAFPISHSGQREFRYHP